MARRLAPALSHLAQLILATVPLFFVLCYFLALAAKRPAKQYYQYQDDDVAFQNMVNADGPVIDLDYILYVFLAFFVLWACGAVYIGIFVPKRHQLIDAYVTQSETIIGDVKYAPRRNLQFFCALWKRFSPEYAIVTYRHPDPVADGVTRSSNSDKRYVVTKKVRTYQPFSREKVAISVLPGLPRSGQPQSDIEYDFASFTEAKSGRRDRPRGILTVMGFWVVFTLLGSIFICLQMNRLDEFDPDVDAEAGWKTWALVVFLATPLVAFGFNWWRWSSHRKWLTHEGRVVKEGSAEDKAARPGLEDDQPGCDADNLCGTASVDDDESHTPYNEMV